MGGIILHLIVRKSSDFIQLQGRKSYDFPLDFCPFFCSVKLLDFCVEFCLSLRALVPHPLPGDHVTGPPGRARGTGGLDGGAAGMSGLGLGPGLRGPGPPGGQEQRRLSHCAAVPVSGVRLRLRPGHPGAHRRAGLPGLPALRLGECWAPTN